MTVKINQCIIPLAGMGTRWQPISHLYPKELLPIGNIPLLAYILKEVLIAEIYQVVFIVNKEKKPFFRKFIELTKSSKELKALGLAALKFEIVEQKSLNQFLGLGAAVYSARDCFKQDDSSHFVLLLPDVLLSKGDFLKRMKKSFNQSKVNLIALNQVKTSEVIHYGIARFNDDHSINEIIEKPSIHNAPSNWAVLGRYCLSVEIFETLSFAKKGSGGEIQITDSINQLNKSNQKIEAIKFSHQLFDCGQITGFVDAIQNFNVEQFLSTKQ